MSSGPIHHNIMENNRTSIITYQKKSAFGGGRPVFINNIILSDSVNAEKSSSKDFQSKIVMYNNLVNETSDNYGDHFQKNDSVEVIKLIKKSNVLFDADLSASSIIKLKRLSEFEKLIKKIK
jgi:hypothetical protein